MVIEEGLLDEATARQVLDRSMVAKDMIRRPGLGIRRAVVESMKQIHVKISLIQLSSCVYRHAPLWG